MECPDNLPTLFVYGTLKRGYRYHALLAPHARRVVPARVRGVLYDLGEFPALAEGDGIVTGEVVEIAPDLWEQVLRVTDRLEGYDPDDPAGSMYLRVPVPCETENGSITAVTYMFNTAHAGLPPLYLLPVIAGGCWPAGSRETPPVNDELDAFRAHVRRFGEGA